jgi:Family of unknown function (DUF6263)
MKKTLNILVLILIAQFTNAQTTLKLNVADGYKASVVSTTSMKMDIVIKKVKANTKMFLHLDLKEKLANGNFVFNTMLDSFSISSKMGSEEMEVNSNNKKSMEAAEANPQAAMMMGQFADMIGKNVLLEVSPLGKIIKKENDEQATSMIAIIFIEFPEKALKAKDTWAAKTSMEAMGQAVEMDSKYTVKSINTTEAVIILESTNSAMGDEPITSEYTIDVKTGLVKNYSSKMKMMGMMNVETTTIVK